MRIRLAALLFASIVLPASMPRNALFAQTPDAIAVTLARCVDDSAVAVAHVDLQQVNIADAAKGLARIAQPGGSFVDLPALEAIAGQSQAIQEAGVRHIYAVFSPVSLGDDNPYYVAIVEPGRDVAAVAKQVQAKLSNPSGIFVLSTNRKSFAAVAAIGNAVVAGSEMIVARLKASTPAPRPELKSALSATETAPLALLLVPSSDQRKALEETLPELPRSMGGGPTSVFTRGLLWGAVSYSPQRETWDIVIQSENSAAATAVQRQLRDLPARFAKVAWIKVLFPEGQVADSLVPAVTNDMLKLTVKRNDPGALALEKALAEAGNIVRTTLWDTTRRDHVKQIALAMHNFHDVNGRFPAQALYDKNGRALLSWRVQLLPFLEEGKLYKEFHLDEPWDSEHNKQLIGRIPATFRTPQLPLEDHEKTTMLGPVGKRALFRGKQGVKIRNITDGTSMTIMVLEATPNDAVIWTKPDDFDVDAGHLHERLFQGRDSFGTAFCDGAYHPLQKAIKDKTLEWLFTINGGEAVGQF